MRELITLTVKDYPHEIIKSKGRKPIYYSIDDKLPKAIYNGLLANKLSYMMHNGQNVVCDLRDNPIVANTKMLNKPRTNTINGQKLHELNLKPYERSKIITTIKDYVKPILSNQIKDFRIDSFPVKIQYVYFAPSGKIGDLDNHKLFYEKTITDLLKIKMHEKTIKGQKREMSDGLGLLPEDNVYHINSMDSLYFHSDRYDMLIIIYAYEENELNEMKHYYEHKLKR